MKKLFLFFLTIIAVTTLQAQTGKSAEHPASKSVYAELLGGGIGFSANFDSRFIAQNGFGYRAGLGVVPLKGNTVITIPIGLNDLFGHGPSFFEVEVTGTILTKTSGTFNGKTVSPVFIYPHVGYRYSKPSKSFLGRIYAGPMFYGSNIIPFAGLSLGYTL
jgi:hypothetical protein